MVIYMRRKIPTQRHFELAEKAINDAIKFVEENYDEAKVFGANTIYENRLKFIFMPPKGRLSINAAKRIALFASALALLEGEDYHDEVAQIIFEMIYASEYLKKYGKIDFIRYAKIDEELEKIAETYKDKYIHSLKNSLKMSS